MTKVLIIGGGGMIGQKIARKLASEGLNHAPVEKVTLFDLAIPDNGAPSDRTLLGGFGNPDLVAGALSDRPDVVIHLAAIVSGEAEKDFELGWQVNMQDMWTLLEGIRRANEADGYCPRFVFASSVAVYGGSMPDIVPEDFHTTPQSSYGAQKVIGEMLVGDFSRKGFIDGVTLRLPTISVRPGKPNKAASSCFSSIIREPLSGQQAILPIARDTVHIHASPRSAAAFFCHAATLDTALVGSNRTIVMPCVSCSVDEQIEALRQHAGADVLRFIKHEQDPTISKVVETWPRGFSFERATNLGFKAESNFAEIIEVYVSDDFPAVSGTANG